MSGGNGLRHEIRYLRSNPSLVYYIHLRANYILKGMNHFFPPAMDKTVGVLSGKKLLSFTKNFHFEKKKRIFFYNPKYVSSGNKF